MLMACQNNKDLPTIKDFDLEKYLGIWYEIARLPNRFEKGLDCCTAEYSLKENGKIKVVNRGRKLSDNGKFKSATGTAWIPDENFPGRLKVRFFWPFSGNYYIIELDKHYQYVLVGDPSRKYLWILSRKNALDEETYTYLEQIAAKNGFNVEMLMKVNQDCD